MTNILFIPECREVIQRMEERKVLTPDGEFYSSKTIRTKSQNTDRISEYIDSLGTEITMDSVNYEFAENYRLYLIEKGLAKNTVSGYVSCLRAWVRYFHKLGLMSYSGIGIRCSMELTTAIFNSMDELSEIYRLELTPGREKVRDIYICQCFLGLRVSDLRKFIKEIDKTIKKVEGKFFFEIKTSKTGEVVVIPAASIVLKIFEKYNYNFGNGFSEWYYRRTLKEIVTQSDLEREVFFHRTEGGEKIERIVMYSDLMGTHTARRTFASNAYLAGINPLDIMKITGHKSFNSFFKYIRCENLATALKISDHDFFKTEL